MIDRDAAILWSALEVIPRTATRLVLSIVLSHSLCQAQSTLPGDASPALKIPPRLSNQPATAAPEVDLSAGSDLLADGQLDQQQVRASLQWLGDFALRQMPRSYDGDKDWGKTKRVWSGVDMRMDGWKLKTHRRRRHVQHGRWIRYEVSVQPPPATQPKILINNVTRRPPTSSHPDHWDVDSVLFLPMQFTARVQRWNLGVRLVSFTITGTMQLKVNVKSSVGFLADYSEIPPALAIDPHVHEVDIDLDRFQVQRISDLGGEFAQGWGELIQALLIERLVEKQGDRCKQKLNQAIAEHRDDLKLSLADWLTRYVN